MHHKQQKSSQRSHKGGCNRLKALIGGFSPCISFGLVQGLGVYFWGFETTSHTQDELQMMPPHHLISDPMADLGSRPLFHKTFLQKITQSIVEWMIQHWTIRYTSYAPKCLVRNNCSLVFCKLLLFLTKIVFRHGCCLYSIS